MTKQVTLTIDGKEVTVPEGTLIVDAAKKIGIDIPVFCYHPKMEPVGMCRMCLVEVGRPVIDRATGQALLEADGSPKMQFNPKLETACTTPVAEGMTVIGLSPKVEAARNEIVEFILTSHPLDCPICDKGGECPLQNLTMAHGPGESRFLYDDKMKLAKHVPLGELIYLDRERCIQCGRCVRFQDEIVDDPVIGFYHRGRSLEIVTFSDPGFDSYFSGNTTDICPVGALTTADFRFGARPWELRTTASICSHCPVGCNLAFNIRREARSGGEIVIKRVMPRQNESVNEIWICDKGRFAYHYTESNQRLTQPLIRRQGELVAASWEEALQTVADRFQDAGSGQVSLVGGRLTNEDLFNLQQLSTGLGGKAILYSQMGGGDLVAQVGLGSDSNLGEMGKGSVILVVASNLHEEAPIWWLRVKQAAERGATLIVANPRTTRLDAYANQLIIYSYGEETATILAMVNALSAKRPELPGKVSLSPALKDAAEVFAKAENAIVIFGSEGLGLVASQALAQACANLLIATNHIGRPNNGLVGVWSRANDQGAWDLGLRPEVDLRSTVEAAKAVYIVAADPVGDDPGMADSLRSSGFVVVQDLFLTDTAGLADVVLPALPFTEREGTYTTGERRVQRFYPAVLPRPGCKADFTITGEIGRLLGMDFETKVPARVLMRIAAKTPGYEGLTYRKLAEVTEQWPIIGRGDMYYGGTSYENTQGLGIQLASGAQRGEVISLSWPQAADRTPSIPPGALLAVPVTQLYDRGQTILPSELLHQRIPQPFIVMHPNNIERIGLQSSEMAVIVIDEKEYPAFIRADGAIPPGVVLVPRSFGFPVNEPLAVEVKVLAVVHA